MPVVLCSSQNFIILCLVNLTYHLTSAVQPQFFQLGTILFQGQMELKVKQLEEAQSRLKVKPEAMPNESPHRTAAIGGITRRSLPSTPSEVKSWPQIRDQG